jgi:nucleotide-binding universal stress UspA family protein
MHKLLVPVDGSVDSQRAVQYAGEIAMSKAGAKLLLLNVQEEFERRHVHGLQNPTARHDLKERGEQATADARAWLDRCGCAYEFIIVFGRPAEVIARVAAESHCSAIVMGSRGFGRLKRIFFGSISDAVRRSASIPVTLVSQQRDPESGRQFQRAARSLPLDSRVRELA